MSIIDKYRQISILEIEPEFTCNAEIQEALIKEGLGKISVGIHLYPDEDMSHHENNTLVGMGIRGLQRRGGGFRLPLLIGSC